MTYKEQLDSFVSYARQRQDDRRLTLQDVFDDWIETLPAPRLASSDVDAIQEALEWLKSGEPGIPVDDHLQKMRKSSE